ncbi:MAG: hypothetical protein AAF213_00780 [Pseudomonadota bacterium]
MAKKARKNFYAPAAVEGWYQAIGEGKARRFVENGTVDDIPLYHMAGEKRAALGRVFSAPDNYNLMHMVAAASQSARYDMARVYMRHITAKPERTDAVIDDITARLNDLSLDLWDRLEFHAPNADVDGPRPLPPAQTQGVPHMSPAQSALLTAMATATMVRERAFDEGQELHFNGRLLREEIMHMDEVMPVAQTLLNMSIATEEYGAKAAKSTALEGLATKVNPSFLVRLLDTMPVHYGGPDNWIDGPTRAETVTSLNAINLAMRHWDEVNAQGHYGGGISVREGNFRGLPGAAVQEGAVRVTNQADFDAVRSTPKQAPAADVAEAKPRRP